MHLEIVVLTTHHHPTGPLGARNIIGIGKTKGLNHLGSVYLLQTLGLRATKVHYQQLPLCCPGLTSQTDQDVPDKVDDIDKMGPTWKYTSPSSRMKMPNKQWPTKVGGGIQPCTNVQGVGITPFLPYAIRSLQGYPGELVWSSGTDITLDDMLMILAEHYNNVKVLDALNQELFQLWMTDKESMLDWGVCLSRHLQVLAASFPDHFPPDCAAELMRDHFYGRLNKQLKAVVAYLKVGSQVRTYSDYLRATRGLRRKIQ